MTRTAIVAGAGFAGLAAAAALARNGWDVRVHEADPQPRSAGAGIYVHGFVHGALRRIDAYDKFAAGSFAPPLHSLYINGALQASAPTAGQYVTTTRAILHTALLDAASRAGAEIVAGSRAIGADASGALILEDGSSLEADLIVAADGVRSTVARALEIPITRVPHQDGVTRVLLDRSGLREDKWNNIHDYYDYSGRPLRVLYSPCGPDAFYFCLMAPITDVEATAVPVAIELWAEKFPDLATPLRRIGAAGRHDRYATTTLRSWSKGRVAVVGDAAHAMPSSLGQGAGVSIINAVALTDAVADASDVGAALVAWEASMRPTVEAWQRRAEDVASQRSLSRAARPGERPLVELSAANPHRRFLNAESETST